MGVLFIEGAPTAAAAGFIVYRMVGMYPNRIFGV